eukprot:Hpha_TRINITY_DN15860_c5_g1::TRINITY_DN15860_c5_g1_i5::g.190255::m.190255
MKCWGENNRGQLGYGDTIDRGDQTAEMGTNLPLVPIPGGRMINDACLGESHVVVLYDNGQVECWGYASFGQLGNEAGTSVSNNLKQPQDYTLDLKSGLGSETPGSVHCGGGHSCVVSENKQNMTCWGRNSNGQLGLGHTTNKGGAPGDMSDLKSLQISSGGIAAVGQVALGDKHTCVLSAVRDVYCWGYGAFGQLGRESVTNEDDASALTRAVNLACPTLSPSRHPTSGTARPTLSPSSSPSSPTTPPSVSPSQGPTTPPTKAPIPSPGSPTRHPLSPTGPPTSHPSLPPTTSPSDDETQKPTLAPTSPPSSPP